MSPRRKKPEESLLDIIERTPASEGATWPPVGAWPPAGAAGWPDSVAHIDPWKPTIAVAAARHAAKETARLMQTSSSE